MFSTYILIIGAFLVIMGAVGISTDRARNTHIGIMAVGLVVCFVGKLFEIGVPII